MEENATVKAKKGPLTALYSSPFSGGSYNGEFEGYAIFLTCICYFLDRIHYRRTIDVVQGRLTWQTRGNTTGVAAYKSIPGSVWKAGFFFSRVTNRIFCSFCRSVIIIPNSNPQKSITALKVLGVDRKLIGSSNM